MSSNLFKAILHVSLIIAATGDLAHARSNQASSNVLAGTIEKVDSGAKTIDVKTADGTVETIKFTDKTAVHGLKDAAKGATLPAKKAVM